MMAAESQEDGQPLMAEYKAKFPEIPEHVLARILREHGDDPTSCEKILEDESEKNLYGSSPTPDISTSKGFMVSKQKTSPGSSATHGSPLNFNRCNSTGSTGSGHSSGRSTPVNQIPTPWVVPNFHPTSTGAGHATNQHPITSSGGIPSGMVYPQFNGGYYYHPWAGAGHQVLPTSMTVNQTSPNAGYPMINTSGYFPMQSSTVTMPTGTNCRPSASDIGSSVGPEYSTMPNNPTLQPGYLYYTPVSTSGTSSQYYGSNSPQIDPRYQTLPASIPHLPGALMVPGLTPNSIRTETPNLPTSSGFAPVHSPAEVNRHNLDQLHASASNTHISGNNSPYTVRTNPLQIDPRYVTYNMMPSVGGFPTRTNTPYGATTAGLVPINPNTAVPNQSFEQLYAAAPSGETPMTPPTQGLVESKGSSESSSSAIEELRKLGDTSLVPNDEYVRACLSQQMKRLQRLKREYAIEEQRLQLIISEISDRDQELYKQMFRVAPNPTQVDIQKLIQENNGLKRTIEEISKNIDRLDNGRGVLPPASPVINRPHRIVGNKPREPYDRSKSVPCLHEPGASKPPLNRPHSEHDLNIDFEQNRVQYRLTPPSDPSLEEWSMINPTHPNPNIIVHVNNEEDTQWNCLRCTFLNHESLNACEMCGSER